MTFQQIIIVGNVGKDPQMRYLQSGSAVCDFTMATNRRWTNRTGEQQEETVWFRVTCWDKLAETVNAYVTKGKQVMVVGRVKASAYTNQAGQPAASLEVTAQEVRFLGGRDDQAGGAGGNYDNFAPPPDNVDDIPF